MRLSSNSKIYFRRRRILNGKFAVSECEKITRPMNTINLPQMSPAAVEGLRALLHIIESGLATAPPPPVAPRRTVQELGNEFLVSKARTGKSVRYLLAIRSSLTLLFKGRMLRQVHTVTSEEIESWADEGKLAVRTRRNQITNARIFFEFALRRGYVTSNPATPLELPPPENKPVAIMTPEHIAEVLRVASCVDRDVMRLLAVQFFGGLRTSEAMRLNESEIGPRYIEVKAEKCKTRRRRLVTISPTLRAWLDFGGKLPVENCWHRLVSVKRAAGVPFPPNAARHSFCSYHFAQFQSAVQTAMQAGHSEAMLFAHYRELVTPESASQFWAILPNIPEINPA
jgi:integrase